MGLGKKREVIVRSIFVVSLFIILSAFFLQIVFAVTDSCEGGLTGECRGAATGDGALSVAVYSPYNWLIRNDPNSDPTYVSYSLYTSTDSSVQGSITINSSGVVQGRSRVPLKSTENGYLCQEEGTYMFSIYTGFKPASEARAVVPGYTLYGEDSSDICTCINSFINPDNSSTVFPYPTTYQWSDSSKTITNYSCCGPPDSRCVGTDSLVCDNDAGKFPFSWYSSNQRGCTYELGCFDNSSVLSDGSQFIKCGANYSPKSLYSFPALVGQTYDQNGLALYSGYACLKKTNDRYKLYECENSNAGASGACLDPKGAATISAGTLCAAGGANGKKPYVNFTEPNENGTAYCLYDGKFDFDLDVNDEVHYRTCVADGFRWTGTMCCQDLDRNESYNDFGIVTTSFTGLKGGCLEGKYIQSGKLLNESGFFGPLATGKVVNHKGIFYGCNLTNNALLNEIDSHTQGSLIDDSISSETNNLPVCSILINSSPSTSYYCSNVGVWKKVNSSVASMHTATIIPSKNGSALPKTECCLKTECWNGTTCIPSLNSLSRDQLDTDSAVFGQYACVENIGEAIWSNFSGFKSSFDSRYFSTCPRLDQCLVNAAGRADLNDQPQNYTPNSFNVPLCIANGQFIQDYFCKNGAWTTRTKKIAEQLLENIGSSQSYTLFCDNFTSTLNNVNYLSENNLVSNTLIDANNFCVLKSTSLIFGASLNKKINNTQILQILGAANSACDNADSSQDQFVRCSGSTSEWNIFYNGATQSIIFTKGAFTPSQNPNSFESRFSINQMIQSVQTLARGTGNAMPFVNLTHGFGKLYVFNSNQKQIVGFFEQNYYGTSRSKTAVDYFAVKYSGFNTDICKLTNDFVSPNRNLGFCANQNGNQFVFTSAPGSRENGAMLGAWADLTAKTRASN